ncbi:MAG TPA: hypothetical protein VIK32_14085 [Candidatus Limnocylindrales bacterium]
MRFGRIGGLLIVGGVALLLIIVASGGPVGTGGSAALSRALILGLVGCGVAVLAWAGPGLLRGRVVRVGLVILAAGLLGESAASILDAANEGSNLFFALFFFGGLIVLYLGALVTGLSLIVITIKWLRARDRTRSGTP